MQEEIFEEYLMLLLRIPVETNINSSLKANSNSGNIRTPFPVYANDIIGSHRDYLLSITGL